MFINDFTTIQIICYISTAWWAVHSYLICFVGEISSPHFRVILDAENSMQRHVELRRVHRYLNHETAVKVANALISSHLDYVTHCFVTQKDI